MHAQDDSKKIKTMQPEAAHRLTKDATRSSSSEVDKERPGSLEQVRDILFGAQSREHEKRLAQIQERLLGETGELRNDLKLRFDSLEQYIKKEIELLTSRVKAEQGVRADLIKDLSRELKDITKMVGKKVGQLEEQMSLGQSDLRQQILDQQKSLSREIQEKHDALKRTLNQAIQELRENKVERNALAEMLLNGAMYLNNDLMFSEKSDSEKQKK